MSPSKILILGIGNELAGDDALGPRILREISEIGPPGIDYKQISSGGLLILESILGYEKVLIIDTIETDSLHKRILKITPEDFSNSTFLSSPHDVNFPTALELGKKTAIELMPDIIRIIGVEIPRQKEFSDQISAETQRKIPKIIKLVLEEIRYFLNENNKNQDEKKSK
ncbi:MAG: hydrogenase maturation protease [Candidatus Heimdallarchaeota archaeon]